MAGLDAMIQLLVAGVQLAASPPTRRGFLERRPQRRRGDGFEEGGVVGEAEAGRRKARGGWRVAGGGAGWAGEAPQGPCTQRVKNDQNEARERNVTRR